ncbi:MAG: FecR family protein [Agriterribacter sp.]
MGQTLSHLLDKYLANTISKNELVELLRMAEDEKEYPALKTALNEHWKKSATAPQKGSPHWDARFYAMMEKEAAEISDNPEPAQSPKRWIYRLSAAAAVLLVLLPAYYLFFLPKQKDTTPANTPVAIAKDVAAPASSNAILVLSNGQQIVLDTATMGSVAMQGNINIQKGQNGEIIYTGDENGSLQYNTLTVPRGSKIADIILSDGTRVWLNAGSSLRYPVSFEKDKRRVEMIGEAYFEVQSLPLKNGAGKTPFVVATTLPSGNNGEVEVLGTHFNVNAYEDEKDIKVTLLEGAVKVNKGAASVVLKPGEQAAMKTGIQVAGEIDVDEVMAWKNGKFQFGEAADINMIMRQVARWYDVEIEYRDQVSGHIGGTISRNQNVSKVLQMLEMTGAVKFSIEGRKVTVMLEKH